MAAGRRAGEMEGAPPQGGERGYTWENKMKNTMTTTEVAHRGRRSSSEPRRNPPIDEDSEVRSTNRMHQDEALDEMIAAVPSDSADDTQNGCNCSTELEPLRTSTSNFGRWGMNLGKPFCDSERVRRGEAKHIYIARVQTR
jgi:hypothetical protein